MSKLNAKETERLIEILERVLKETLDVAEVQIIIGIDDIDEFLTEGVDNEILPQEAEGTVGSL